MIMRRHPDFHRRGCLGRHHAVDFPEWSSGCAVSTTTLPSRFLVRHPGPTQLDPGRGPVPPGRPPGPLDRCGQLLLPRRHCRSAPKNPSSRLIDSPTTRCCRPISPTGHPAQRLGSPNFTALHGQRPKARSRIFHAWTADGHDEPEGRVTTSEPPWDPPGPRWRTPAAGFPHLPTPDGQVDQAGPSAGCGRELRPTTARERRVFGKPSEL